MHGDNNDSLRGSSDECLEWWQHEIEGSKDRRMGVRVLWAVSLIHHLIADPMTLHSQSRDLTQAEDLSGFCG